MFNKKNKRVITAVLAIILVIAMVVPSLLLILS